jgi:threonine/homoserine/homoserine lactone efflux protein
MMPLSPTLLAAFLVAALVIFLTPGPDMLYVLTHGISQGVTAGLVAAGAMAVGMLIQASLVAGGLAALLHTHPLAFEITRWTGAAYLAYIGIQTLRHSSDKSEIREAEPVSLWTVARRALVTNLTNVKIIFFYLAFLPQFVDQHRGHATLQLAILGLIFVVMGLLTDSVVAIASGRLGEWLLKKPGASSRLNQVAGFVFIGLAAHIAI